MKFDLLIRNVNLLTMCGDESESTRLGYAVGCAEGKIAWVGEDGALPSRYSTEETFDGVGGWLLPGLIDCHTHLVYAGDRTKEFEARQKGKTYQEIASEGGGILSTVRETRAAGEDELLGSALQRLECLLAEGVTGVEIKSGYGLNLDTELKMLRVAKRVSDESGVRVSATYLGAHCVPLEMRGSSDEYCDQVTKDLDVILETRLADSVDAFCETVGLSPEQTLRILSRAKELGFPVKLHADQLTDTGGGALIASLGGLSADHVEYTSVDSSEKMAKSGTIAVLLPGAFYFLKETKVPPIGSFRSLGVPMAVATDCNPGTSPLTSILTAMNMACVLFGLTPWEALQGVTCNASRALGWDSMRGRIAVGMDADLALFQVNHPRELASRLGASPLDTSWVGGKKLQNGRKRSTIPS